MVTITLTGEQALVIRMILMLTTGYRSNEAEACERLSKEMDEDGNPKYPAMANNAAWWKEANAIAEEVLEILKQA